MIKKNEDIFFIQGLIFSVSIIMMSCISGCKKPATLFTQLTAAKTNISFANNLPEKEQLNILYDIYFYNGGGVSVGDINNDGLPDIYFTANTKGSNKLYLNKGNFTFEDITINAGVAGTADWCSGVTMADVNGDGYLDIYVCAVAGKLGLQGHNELFINNRNNTFTESSAKYGLGFTCASTQAVFFDYDHDGDLDCYLLNQSQRPHANITDTSSRNKYDPVAGDKLLRNDMNTTAASFTDVSAAAGIYQSSLGYGLGLAVADLNNDGWDDIYVGNDFHENDYYYINNGNGKFSESSEKHFKHYSRFSMGNDIADFNNDGQPDIVTADMLPADEKILKTYGSDENMAVYKQKLESNGYQQQFSKNCLQRNNGGGLSFSETALISGIAATDWSWSPLFADFDNDGNKDLFISNGIVKRPVDLDFIRFVSDMSVKEDGQQNDNLDDEVIKKMPGGSAHPFIFKGDGVLHFTDVSKDWGTLDMKGFYTGAAYADLDNDGNLDIIINSVNAPAVILKNNASAKKSINISFKGNDGNTFGIGTKAWFFSNGKMQYQQLMLTRGFQSSCDARLHFGCDSLAKIDSLLIVWPNQQYEVLKNLTQFGSLMVNQNAAGGTFNYAAFFKTSSKIFDDITTQVTVDYQHKENAFDDYNRQYLVPHILSTRGPKIAVADVNKDGLDDFYVCGAAGQAGQLMLQTREGNFVSKDSTLFNLAKESEEVDAAFFDANGDGYPDLYVVSGGNEFLDGSPQLADHFYLSDGKGNFSAASESIPSLLKNKSCITVADIDNDGDKDIFLGGLTDAKEYGKQQDAYLLLNIGKGIFSVAATTILDAKNMGMVTGASFGDINNDGWPDLVVCGEWMPVKYFVNNRGVFTENNIAKSTGLWQTTYLADVNGDGLMDILAGNWGHNSKLYAGKTGPLKLYVKDFDKNNSTEQILCYTINGEEYTFLAKDELEHAIPLLRKAYLTYGEVAGKTVQYMFFDLFKDYRELKAEELGSACFINNGKAGFTKILLPDEVQLAPVFCFVPIDTTTTKSFMALGNFYGVMPYEGRYDALPPTLFSYSNADHFFNIIGTLPLQSSEDRDAKWLNCNGGKKVLIVAENNKPPRLYKKLDRKG